MAKDYIEAKTVSKNIYTTSKVPIDSTDYAEGMFVSAGQVGGLLKFSKIEDTLLVNNMVSLFLFSFFAKTTNAATLSI